MLLAYVLVFLLHLSASTCHATSRNQHLLFAVHAGHDDAAALLPAAMIHHRHHHGHAAKAEQVLSVGNYNDDVRQYHHPAMMARRWGGGAPPPTSPASVDLSGIGGSPPRLTSLKSAVEPTSGVVEGAPPPPPSGKQDTSAAMDPSQSPMASPAHGEAGASSSSDDVDVNADYDGPMTHPPSHN